MSLRINDTAPNFTAGTTQGTITFHNWIGDKWAGDIEETQCSKVRYPGGSKTLKPYLRLVKQPT